MPSQEIMYSERYSDDVYGRRGLFWGRRSGSSSTQHFAAAALSVNLLSTFLAQPSLCAEYRHVILPPDIASMVPKDRLMSEVRAAEANRKAAACTHVWHPAPMSGSRCLPCAPPACSPSGGPWACSRAVDGVREGVEQRGREAGECCMSASVFPVICCRCSLPSPFS